MKAVIFDMYETLITHYRQPLYFSKQMAEDAGIPDAAFKALWRPTNTPRSIGQMTLEDALTDILRAHGRYSDALLEKLVRKRMAVKEGCFRTLHPEVIPMLDALKTKGVKIGLVSNCFSEEADVIRKSALFSYFDAVCLSYEEGVMKPEPEIFLRCVQRLGVDAGDCLYMGDGGSNELEAAAALGMRAAQAVWYFREDIFYPSARMERFKQMTSPLDVVKEV